jgi:hypothetical protein
MFKGRRRPRVQRGDVPRKKFPKSLAFRICCVPIGMVLPRQEAKSLRESGLTS